MEWLKKLLGEDLYNKVVEALKGKGKDGKDIEFLQNDGTYIPKAKFDEKLEEIKALKGQLDERDKQFKKLQEKAKGNEELENTIKTLQEANKTTKEQYEGKIKELTINSAIQAKLTDTKYPDLLVGKFDKSKLVLNADGTVTGIDEQLTNLKETYKDLFVPASGGGGANPAGAGNTVKNPWSKEHFNLTEQGRILKENPELARQLIASSK